MDSIEKNKMIAEFMGARVEVQTEVAQPYFRGISWTGWFCGSSDKEWCLNNALSNESDFDKNWNNLNKVVEKIESMGYWTELMSGASTVFSIGRKSETSPILFSNGKLRGRINHVYDGVIQFIQYYNATQH